MKEIWRELIRYKNCVMPESTDQIICVSNLGNIKKLKYKYYSSKGFYFDRKENILLKNKKTKSGYILVRINYKDYLLHRLVCFAFLKNPENKKCVNHKNAIKNDNRVNNLEWCTHDENSKHATKNNLYRKSKITKKTRKRIRKMRKKYYTSKEISKHFNLSEGSIRQILKKVKELDFISVILKKYAISVNSVDSNIYFRKDSSKYRIIFNKKRYGEFDNKYDAIEARNTLMKNELKNYEGLLSRWRITYENSICS